MEERHGCMVRKCRPELVGKNLDEIERIGMPAYYYEPRAELQMIKVLAHQTNDNCREMRAWLREDRHLGYFIPGGKERDRTAFYFSDPDTAFHFKMTWG